MQQCEHISPFYLLIILKSVIRLSNYVRVATAHTSNLRFTSVCVSARARGCTCAERQHNPVYTRIRSFTLLLTLALSLSPPFYILYTYLRKCFCFYFHLGLYPNSCICS